MANWQPWNMGWGETAKLAKGLEISASKSMSRNEGFKASVFGLNLKKDFQNIEEAKQAAERLAAKLLAQALLNLDRE